MAPALRDNVLYRFAAEAVTDSKATCTISPSSSVAFPPIGGPVATFAGTWWRCAGGPPDFAQLDAAGCAAIEPPKTDDPYGPFLVVRPDGLFSDLQYGGCKGALRELSPASPDGAHLVVRTGTYLDMTEETWRITEEGGATFLQTNRELFRKLDAGSGVVADPCAQGIPVFGL